MYDSPKHLMPPFVLVVEALLDTHRARHHLHRYGRRTGRVSVGRRCIGRVDQDHLYPVAEHGDAAQNHAASDGGRGRGCSRARQSALIKHRDSSRTHPKTCQFIQRESLSKISLVACADALSVLVAQTCSRFFVMIAWKYVTRQPVLLASVPATPIDPPRPIRPRRDRARLRRRTFVFANCLSAPIFGATVHMEGVWVDCQTDKNHC